MKWLKQSFAALFLILVLVACEYDYVEIATPPPPDPGDTNNPVDTVYFAAQVEPLFSSNNCTNCHNSGNFLNLTAGSAYASIVANGFVTAGDATSVIYTEPLPTGSHYAKYANNDEANLVLQWIYQGALDN